MKSRTIRLLGPSQRSYAHQSVEDAPTGYVVKIAAETRRDRQNALMWKLIDELRKQVPEMAAYSADDVKLRFLHALGAEMRFLPALEGQGMFPCGMRSSTLTVEQFSGLIELILQWAANQGVVLQDPRDE